MTGKGKDARQRDDQGCQVEREEGCQVEGGGLPGSRKRNARQKEEKECQQEEEEGCQARGGGMPGSRRRDARQGREGMPGRGRRGMPAEARQHCQQGRRGRWRSSAGRRVRLGPWGPRGAGRSPAPLGPPARSAAARPPLRALGSAWRLRRGSLERGRSRERLQRARHLIMS